MMEKDKIKEAKQAFKACSEAERENRDNALDDLKFGRLGEQWPEKVRKAREDEGRPCLTINRMNAFIRQVVNDARQNKPSIKVHPADDSADPETAKIFDGLIRNIEYSSNADVAYDTAVEHAVSMGFGYFRINLDYADHDSFDQDIVIQRVSNPLTVYGDPMSEAADSSDWNVAFVTEMLKVEDFKRRYPQAKVSSFDADRDEENDLWFEEDSVRVAEYWTREEIDIELLRLSDGQVLTAEQFAANQELFYTAGIQPVQTRQTKGHKVYQCLMTADEIISETPWAGRYIPIVPVYGDEVNVEGKRVFRSLIRDARDAQMMFNYWRTMSTEMVALAPKSPWVGPVGAFVTDQSKWETANVKNHAYLEYDGPQPPTRMPMSDIPAGAIHEALSASDDMKAILGLYDASLGNKSNETSGIAIRARQMEGDTSTFHFIDNMTRAIRHGGRILLDLIPKVYTTDRIIRVLGEDGTPSTVPLGQEVQLPGGVSRVFDLSAGKYDLTVKAGPNYTTKREEAAAQMVELIRSFPDAAPVIGDLVAKNLDWPGADEIAERLKAINPALKAPEDPMNNPDLLIEKEKLNIQKEKAASDISIAQQKLELERQKAAMDMEFKQADHAMGMEQMRQKHDADMEMGRQKTQMQLHGETLKAVGEPPQDGTRHPLVQLVEGVIESNLVTAQAVTQAAQGMQAAAQGIQQAAAVMAADTEVVRDPKTGRAVGARKVLPQPETMQ